MKKNSNTILIILFIILVIGGLIWLSRREKVPDVAATSQGVLSVSETNYNFGSVSMAAGKVNRVFKITNNSTEAVAIKRMSTSCMCTVASLLKSGEQFGPFGMPGHGFIPEINQTIEPGEEAEVKVTFDPAAHGPAGVGQIARQVTLETNNGQPILFNFSALVTP